MAFLDLHLIGNVVLRVLSSSKNEQAVCLIFVVAAIDALHVPEIYLGRSLESRILANTTSILIKSVSFLAKRGHRSPAQPIRSELLELAHSEAWIRFDGRSLGRRTIWAIV